MLPYFGRKVLFSKDPLSPAHTQCMEAVYKHNVGLWWRMCSVTQFINAFSKDSLAPRISMRLRMWEQELEGSWHLGLGPGGLPLSEATQMRAGLCHTMHDDGKQLHTFTEHNESKTETQTVTNKCLVKSGSYAWLVKPAGGPRRITAKHIHSSFDRLAAAHAYAGIRESAETARQVILLVLIVGLPAKK